jgi:hypothetical protein
VRGGCSCRHKSNGKQAKQIKGLEAERDALKKAKTPKEADVVRDVTLEWEWDSGIEGEY